MKKETIDKILRRIIWIFLMIDLVILEIIALIAFYFIIKFYILGG